MPILVLLRHGQSQWNLENRFTGWWDVDPPAFAMDIHGDEAIPANFLAGFEGIPSLSERQSKLFHLFSETLERLSPDFQTR